jgi:tetratricopeptide (TPR) repeat protein
MTDREREALHLCSLGLQHMWRGEIDSAIALYDRAAAAAESDETRELITIRKAEALIAADREGVEISALPGIVMRRRSHRHVYMAATVLMRRFVEAEDRRRAIFYGEIARAAVAQLEDSFARATVLNSLGVTMVADSQFKAAIEAFDEALGVLDPAKANEQIQSLRAALLANLGGAKVLLGQAAEGIRILERALPDLEEEYDRVEAFLDLCFGYMEIGRPDVAEQFGRRALQLATVPRQVRNANHLLGEICLRTDRYEEADALFDVVASFYPDFRNVKQLLVAVDLCSVVNWKA